MNRLFGRLLLTGIAVAGLAGCASEEDTVIMAPVPEVYSQFTPVQDWNSYVDNGVGQYFSKLQPVFAYEKVFVASRIGQVKALDAATGSVVWDTEIETDTSGASTKLSGGITASYNKIFIGSENAEVICLDAETGAFLWSTPVVGEVLAKPVTDNNYVIVHTSRGMLVALNAETGDEVWHINTDVPNLTLRGDSSPATTSGGVFWGTANGRLAGAIVKTGQLLWQQPIGSPKGSTEIDRLVDVDSKPIIVGGKVYIVGINGQLTGIDLRTGKVTWKRTYSSALDMDTDGSALFLVTDVDHITAVDLRSGTELWTNDRLENRLLTAPAIIDGYIVVGDSEGYLHWVDKESGEFVAQQFIDESGFAVGPIELDDGYVITTRSGSVRKLSKLDNY